MVHDQENIEKTILKYIKWNQCHISIRINRKKRLIKKIQNNNIKSNLKMFPNFW